MSSGSSGNSYLRIIAGSARGTRLAPAPKDVRPTADRVRESLFNSLGQYFEGGMVLDLYAGTGALGLESLSRGSDLAVFVEGDRKARSVIHENLRRTRFVDRAEVVGGEVEVALGWLEERGEAFDLIFADPPYRNAPAEVAGRRKGVTRRYGGTFITILGRSELTMIVAVCPGSFDPVTTGHVDVIRRASTIFDHVVVAVGANRRKQARLSAVERARLIEKVTADVDNVSVEIMDGLLVEFAREQGARAIVKGLRAVSDFESEFEQAQLNRTMFPELETVFIMASAEHSFLSSSAVREIASLG